MQYPALPPDEPDRLATLYGYHVLDTPTERTFDELARLAATVAGTPVGALTLIDQDRQWVKAAVGGLDLNMPRDWSVCGHAILSHHDFFEVSDLSADQRFRGNEKLEAVPLRFYGGSPLRAEDGHALGMLCVLDSNPRELTSMQRDTLKQLSVVAMACLDMHRRHREQEWFGRIAEDVTEEIFVIDARTLRVVHANRTALARRGLTFTQLRKLSANELARTTRELPLDALRNGGETVSIEGWCLHRDGTSYPVDMRWYGTDTPGGRVIVCTAQDITDRKRLDRMKEEFTAMVSHELRAPLTGMQGALELLHAGAAGDLPSDARQLVGVALQSGEQLRRIVGDLLDLERLDSDSMEFRIEQVPALDALRQLAKLQQDAARKRAVTLAVAGEDETLLVLADGHRLQQMLGNLLSNALKYAPEVSRVTIAARADGAQIVFEVTDCGAGVPESFRDRIFQRFAQADLQTTRTKGGSGLGLSIVKTMAARMNGTVGYASEPGCTKFWIRLPRA